MTTSMIRAVRATVLTLAVSVLLGCVSVQMPPPSGSAETAEKLRAANLAPAKTGTFAVAPGKDPAMDRDLGGLRGSSVTPHGGSFSQTLKEQVTADLKAAGLYDPNSLVSIEAQLVDSKVDAAIGTGTARLAARFTVTSAGKRRYDKELAVDANWESSFIGAVAIPAAINQYTALYKALTAKLFDDPDFRAALRR
jgi:hypothetical protein